MKINKHAPLFIVIIILAAIVVIHYIFHQYFPTLTAISNAVNLTLFSYL